MMILVVLVLKFCFTTIFNYGVATEKAKRSEYYQKLATAQSIDSKNKWMNRMGDSTMKLVLDNARTFINEF